MVYIDWIVAVIYLPNRFIDNLSVIGRIVLLVKHTSEYYVYVFTSSVNNTVSQSFITVLKSRRGYTFFILQTQISYKYKLYYQHPCIFLTQSEQHVKSRYMWYMWLVQSLRTSRKCAAAGARVIQSSNSLRKKTFYSKTFCRFSNIKPNSKKNFSFRFSVLSLKKQRWIGSIEYNKSEHLMWANFLTIFVGNDETGAFWYQQSKTSATELKTKSNNFI